MTEASAGAGTTVSSPPAFEPRRLASNLLFLLTGELAAKLVNFAAFVWLGRTLGPARYGNLEFTLAVTVFFTLAVDLGLGVHGAREIARSPGEAPGLLALISRLRAALALAALATLAVLAAILPAPDEVKASLLAYGCSLLGMPLLLQWYFQGHDRMQWVALASLVRYGVFAVLLFAVMRPGRSLAAVGMVECGAVAATGLFCLAVAKRRFGASPFAPLDFRRRAIGCLRQAAPIGLTELVWACLWYIATVLLGLMVRDASLGWFGASHRILMALHTFVWLYFFNLLPAITRTVPSRREELVTLLGGSMRLAAWAGLLVAAAGGLLARPALTLAYGSAYAGGGRVLAVMLWVLPVALISGHFRYTLIAYGRQLLLLRATAWSALLVVAGCLLLVPWLGAQGAAWSLLAGCLLEAVLTRAYVGREIVRLDSATLLRRPLMAGAAAMGLFLAIRSWQPVWAGAAAVAVVIALGLLWEGRRLRRLASVLVSLPLWVHQASGSDRGVEGPRGSDCDC